MKLPPSAATPVISGSESCHFASSAALMLPPRTRMGTSSLAISRRRALRDVEERAGIREVKRTEVVQGTRCSHGTLPCITRS